MDIPILRKFTVQLQPHPNEKMECWSDQVIKGNPLVVKVRNLDNLLGQDHQMDEYLPHNGKQRDAKQHFCWITTHIAIKNAECNAQRAKHHTHNGKCNNE